jgi:Glyoxalase-like domain
VHRSRLTAALVDVPEESYDREVAFWAAATGTQPTFDLDDPEYADLGEVTPGMRMMVQRVGAAGRVHLDIETDDVEAEVSRLEKLGAARVQKVRTWWVMRDPSGLLFCVVRVQSPAAFEAHARTWDPN